MLYNYYHKCNTQACNQIGTPGGEEFSEGGLHVLNYVQ